jgi:hypothetical protein
MTFADKIARITIERKDEVYKVVVDNMTCEIIVAVGAVMIGLFFVWLKYKK